MSAGLACAANSVIIDTVVSSENDGVRFEIYMPDSLGNRGSYSRLSTALLKASEQIGFAAESEAVLEITCRKN